MFSFVCFFAEIPDRLQMTKKELEIHSKGALWTSVDDAGDTGGATGATGATGGAAGATGAATGATRGGPRKPPPSKLSSAECSKLSCDNLTETLRHPYDPAVAVAFCEPIVVYAQIGFHTPLLIHVKGIFGTCHVFVLCYV